MAHFADLTPYAYWPPDACEEPWPTLPLLNIGWLDIDQPFTAGVTPPATLDRITELARVRVRQTRGYHLCPFCVHQLADDARQGFDLGLVAQGSAEFRVYGDRAVYAAPELVPHYISTHNYLPPAEFRQAATT